MTCGAIDEWVPVFDSINVSQEIKNDGVRYFRHDAGDFLGLLVILLPLAQRTEVPTPHEAEPVLRQAPSHTLTRKYQWWCDALSIEELM